MDTDAAEAAADDRAIAELRDAIAGLRNVVVTSLPRAMARRPHWQCEWRELRRKY